MIKNNAYNSAVHNETFKGERLFSQEYARTEDISVGVVTRSGTWGKVFDFNNEGITDNNYQAHTYDITVKNNTNDKVSDFSFKLLFDKEVFLSSAWNGSLEIHQNVNSGEIVAVISDLREFVPEEHKLETVTVDGESLIPMKKGDYLVYFPSSAINAVEIPIEPLEATTPGIIMYTAMGEDIEDAILLLEYKFHRLLTSEPLFGCLWWVWQYG